MNTDSNNHEKRESKHEAWKMFDRIADRYDFLNRFLSARQDVSWRKKVADFLPLKRNLKLLDLATGTGDQILYLINSNEQIQEAIGMDLSEKMLEIGRKKVSASDLENKVELVTGDATNIPCEDNLFDVVTISFGIRNVTDISKSLSEMFRVLKPGGRCIILEFSIPSSSYIRKPYLYYFRNVLPKIGSIVSGDTHAYKYLNNTVEDFPYGEKFLKMIKETGFTDPRETPLSFGISSIYSADKPKVNH